MYPSTEHGSDLCLYVVFVCQGVPVAGLQDEPEGWDLEEFISDERDGGGDLNVVVVVVIVDGEDLFLSLKGDGEGFFIYLVMVYLAFCEVETGVFSLWERSLRTKCSAGVANSRCLCLLVLSLYTKLHLP